MLHRRFLLPLAAGVVGLLAISPALVNQAPASAASSKPSKPAKSGKSGKSTTSSTGGNAASNPDDSSSGQDAGSNSGTDANSGSSGASDGNGAPNGPNGSNGQSGQNGQNGPGQNGAPSSTAPGSAGHTSSTTCNAPETNQGPAPQMGEPAQTHEADPAGTVDVERLSETELRIAKATPNDGWVEQVATPSGPRVTVKFTRQGQSPTLIRFAASMDQKGTMIHVRVTSCG